MSELHRACLSLGSNLQPGQNLRQVVASLSSSGGLEAVSTVWESKPVRSAGPNFLNACVLYRSSLDQQALKEQILAPLERNLGRERGADRYAPRPIDIDVVLWDDSPEKLENWEHGFTIVPMAELLPDFVHPATREPLAVASARLRAGTWMRPRPDVLAGLVLPDGDG